MEARLVEQGVEGAARRALQRPDGQRKLILARAQDALGEIFARNRACSYPASAPARGHVEAGRGLMEARQMIVADAELTFPAEGDPRRAELGVHPGHGVLGPAMDG